MVDPLSFFAGWGLAERPVGEPDLVPCWLAVFFVAADIFLTGGNLGVLCDRLFGLLFVAVFCGFDPLAALWPR